MLATSGLFSGFSLVLLSIGTMMIARDDKLVVSGRLANVEFSAPVDFVVIILVAAIAVLLSFVGFRVIIGGSIGISIKSKVK